MSDDQCHNIYSTISVVFGSIIAKIYPRVDVKTDENSWFKVQEDITLPRSNEINDNYDYDFNDTANLMKDKAAIYNETYESLKTERRGRDKID